MLENYKQALKDILCKVAQIDEEINDKILKKIEEIYFHLTGSYFTKKKIYTQILRSNNHKLIERYLKKNIESLEITQKIDILRAAEETIAFSGIGHIKATEFIEKLKLIVFDFKTK